MPRKAPAASASRVAPISTRVVHWPRVCGPLAPATAVTSSIGASEFEPRIGNVVQSLLWFFLKTAHEQRAN
jgi:hypothetical protein